MIPVCAFTFEVYVLLFVHMEIYAMIFITVLFEIERNSK